MRKKGFTLIESMVAITVLTLAIISATGAIQVGISSYIYSKEQIVAFYLAQEGLEQIRNIRDENSLKGQPWLTGIAADVADPCYFGSSCIVDPVVSAVPTRCSAPGSCPVIRQNAATGFFGYNASWTALPYRREITLTYIDDKEVAVNVNVSWSKGSLNRQFNARENIFDWQ